MTLLAPYWLFAATAILIPIAIHLWNKRQGKTVKVGSIRWLEASASNRWSSIKLNNFWLLLLRCFIFILLAVALAQPVWRHLQTEFRGAKAVYIGEELLYTSALTPIKPTVDSLVKRGYTLYSYSPRFKEIHQTEWQKISSRTQDSALTDKPNYWSLLKALTSKHNLPQDSIWLFTSDQQQYFKGARPTTFPQNITWIPVATDASINWLQAAIQTTPDSLLLVFGQTSRDGTEYFKYPAKATVQSIVLPNNQEVKLQHKQDTLIAHSTGSQSKVRLQTDPLRVAFINDKAHQIEVRYLQAAIKAISNYTNLPITLTADTTIQPDWVFWLHTKDVPESIIRKVKQGTNLWVQQHNSSVATPTRIAGSNIKVQHLLKSQNEPDNNVRTTATGESLLAFSAVGRGKVYSFNSDFAANWNDLSQSAELPELLLPLFFPQLQNIKYDFRAVDEKQLMPTFQKSLTKTTEDRTTSAPLLKWLVLAAFGLFLIERIIASRRMKA